MSTHLESRQPLAKPGRYLTFVLDRQSYGVPIMAVREINQMSEITAIPRAPSFMLGVINLRGKVIPVADLRLKLNVSRTTTSRQTCIVVIETDAGQIGMVVDEVSDVVELHGEQIEAAPNLGDGTSSGFLMGLGKVDGRILILIDIQNALPQSEILSAPLPQAS